MEIKNNFFVCKKCKDLVFYRDLIDNHRTICENDNSSNTIFSLSSDNQMNGNIEKFQIISNILKDYGIIDFPVCDKCLTNLEKQIKSLELLLHRTNESLHELPYQHVEGIFMQFLNDQKICTDKKTKKKTDIVEKYDQLEIPKLEVNFNKIEISNFVNPGFTMLLYSSFYITTDNLYIVLNKSRIGFYNYSKNTIVENNAGLGFLIHFIWAFMTKFNIKTEEFSIQPNGNIFVNNKILEFRIPSDKNPNFSVFNHSLICIFKASNLIFKSDMVKNYGINVPFAIDIKNNKIAGIPFKLTSEKFDEKWSLAMKFLLMNFKIIQILLSKASN